jgi:hypothetical protein
MQLADQVDIQVLEYYRATVELSFFQLAQNFDDINLFFNSILYFRLSEN